MTSHLYYYHTFGSMVSRRTSETITSNSSQSTADMELITGSQEFCVFIAKAKVKYAASNASSYQAPGVNKADINLTTEKSVWVWNS